MKYLYSKKIFFATSFILLIGFSVVFANNAQLVSWNELSDTDLSPSGRSALSSLKDPLHAESEHFIYHFTDEKESDMILSSAETYYGWAKEMFGIKEDVWNQKGQVFVFLDARVWKDFKITVNVDKGSGAFTNGRELFIYKNPSWLSPRITLAHELTHIILYRFLDGPIPLFLNEGFAEYIGYRAGALQANGDEYQIRTIRRVATSEFIPVEELISSKSYPAEKMEVFYRESELLVRFLLALKPSDQFYVFLKNISGGQSFEQALNEVYEIDFELFKKNFVIYATHQTSPSLATD